MSWQENPAEARADFLRDGVFVARGFLAPEEASEVRSFVQGFLSERAASLGDLVFYEDRARPETLKQVQELFRHDPFFERMFVGSSFERLAEVLLGGPVTAKNMQYFDKPPGANLPTPPHQDGHYFMIEPNEALTMWLALDEVDEENGCLRYIPGSHTLGLRPHARTEVIGFSQGITDYGTPRDLENERAISARPGDLLVHHAGTIHCADGNQSTGRHRRALGFIYYSAQTRVDKAAHAAYQEWLREELRGTGRL